MSKTVKVDLRDLAKKAEQEVAASKEELLPSPHTERYELTPREVAISLEYQAPDGVDYSAEIISVILDGDARQAKTRVLSQLTRGVNLETMTQEDKYRYEALSRLVTQIKEPPDWLLGFAAEDLELLIYITGLLVEHETRYFRGNTNKSEAGEGASRVRATIPAFKQSASTLS
jgi:hypothetical protein